MFYKVFHFRHYFSIGIFLISIIFQSGSQIPIGIPKNTDYIDTTKFYNLPYNCIGNINHGTYNLIWLDDSITGDLNLAGLGKHFDVELRIGSDSLLGRIRNRSNYKLNYGDIHITGRVIDLRPMSAKMKKSDPFYGYKYNLTVGKIKLRGLITENEQKDIDVNLIFGKHAFKGTIYTSKRFLYYDLKIGSKLILGKRDLSTTECWWYLAKLNKKEFLCFLFVDFLFRDLRYIGGAGPVETPF